MEEVDRQRKKLVKVLDNLKLKVHFHTLRELLRCWIS